LKEIFVRPTASFQQKMQEKLVVAANVSELMQLYGRICEMGTRTDENAYLAGVSKMYKSFMCTRIVASAGNSIDSIELKDRYFGR
jgi:hypothetical protein